MSIAKLSNEAQVIFNMLADQFDKKIIDLVGVEMIRYKTSLINRENWCCSEMNKFALTVWHINEPPHDDNGFGTTLSYKGQYFKYCPFCGAKL